MGRRIVFMSRWRPWTVVGFQLSISANFLRFSQLMHSPKVQLYTVARRFCEMKYLKLAKDLLRDASA